MSHLFITDKEFFKIYQILGFNVVITNEDNIDDLISKENPPLIFISEGFYQRVENQLKKYREIPIIPVPDLENNGEIAKNTINNMLKRFLGEIK